jgi:hypothetical protein
MKTLHRPMEISNDISNYPVCPKCFENMKIQGEPCLLNHAMFPSEIVIELIYDCPCCSYRLYIQSDMKRCVGRALNVSA